MGASAAGLNATQGKIGNLLVEEGTRELLEEDVLMFGRTAEA